jgi:hypothetical protein
MESITAEAVARALLFEQVYHDRSDARFVLGDKRARDDLRFHLVSFGAWLSDWLSDWRASFAKDSNRVHSDSVKDASS